MLPGDFRVISQARYAAIYVVTGTTSVGNGVTTAGGTITGGSLLVTMTQHYRHHRQALWLPRPHGRLWARWKSQVVGRRIGHGHWVRHIHRHCPAGYDPD